MANRRSGYRGRPKKRPNRYDPAAPDYKAVHGASYFAAPRLSAPTLFDLFRMIRPRTAVAPRMAVVQPGPQSPPPVVVVG